jgi:hypothetical protein
LHDHVLSAENDDVIKQRCGCNQFATDSRYVGAFARTAIRGTVQALYTWEGR